MPNEFYVVVNGNTLKYVGYVAVDNDWDINPYTEHSNVRHAYFCTDVEEARERIDQRYTGICGVDPMVARIVIGTELGDFRLREFELLESSGECVSP